MSESRIVCIIGTRPEAIKMAPVVKALRNRGFDAPILATAQHRDLLDQVLAAFHLSAEWDLDAMSPNQNLSQLVARILPKMDDLIRRSGAAAVLGQGDTTTVMAAALASFHVGVPFGHVEAGLRSGSMAAPFPEEGNRRLAGVLARWHFAPTEIAAKALEREGTPREAVHVVGNSVIDALLSLADRADLPWPSAVPRPRQGRRMVLVTLHRRENFGDRIGAILGGIRTFAEQCADADIVYPVHPNPNVKAAAYAALSGLSNVHLIAPVEYPAMVNLLRSAYMVCTDSGGLQEEGPALGKPVLVFRDVTERPEAVTAGGVKLVGSDSSLFLEEARALWREGEEYKNMARKRFPYGDGHASVRIAETLARDLLGREGEAGTKLSRVGAER